MRLGLIFLTLCILFSCDMVKNVRESSDAIVENKQAVEESTQTIRENVTAVAQTNNAIEENLQVVEASSRVIRDNAQAVKESTQVIKENAKVLEATTALIPDFQNSEMLNLLILAFIFFLFGLPLITAFLLSRIIKKLSKIEKDLGKR